MWKFALELDTPLPLHVQLLARYSPQNRIYDLPHCMISTQPQSVRFTFFFYLEASELVCPPLLSQLALDFLNQCINQWKQFADGNSCPRVFSD